MDNTSVKASEDPQDKLRRIQLWLDNPECLKEAIRNEHQDLRSGRYCTRFRGPNGEDFIIGDTKKYFSNLLSDAGSDAKARELSEAVEKARKKEHWKEREADGLWTGVAVACLVMVAIICWPLVLAGGIGWGIVKAMELADQAKNLRKSDK